METQIAHSLAVQAATVQAEIDRMLFERFQNALVWSRSELMQDLRLGDVDKRVSAYLAGLAQGYGDVYGAMDCLSADGRVLASSQAARIGQVAAATSPAAVTVQARLRGGEVSLMLPHRALLGDREPLAIETTVPTAYRGGAAEAQPIARLRLDFDAGQISRLLDGVAAHGRLLLVIDGQGRWVAGSQGMRGRAMPDAVTERQGLVWAQERSDQVVRADAPWLAGPWIAGVGASRADAAWGGSGWTTVVVESVDQALAPVHDMAVIFAALLMAILMAITVAAPWLAAAVARPIAALVAGTRRYQRSGRLDAGALPTSRIAEITELRQAYLDMIGAVEQSKLDLVRSSKLAMLGELAAVLAHEVRTPLGIIRSSAQVLLRAPALDDEGRELLGFIESETRRLDRLVSTLLETARPHPPQFAPCDLHALLARCVQMQALESQARGVAQGPAIELVAAATDAIIDADGEQLMQAIFNLLHNAVQALGVGGRIRLSTADDGQLVQVLCADDGPGIAPEIADKVFDPFFTRREGGLGLGLAVVQQVVRAHGGGINVDRSVWGGTVFVVRLPRRQLERNAARAVA
jgi:signal transduction histidine kinase